MAEGGKEALVRAKDLRPQIILLDLVMPGLSGLETIPLLRKGAPRAGIIALTLMASNGYREAAAKAGADDFVAKGNLNADLVPAIRRVARQAGEGNEHEEWTAESGDTHRR